MLRTTSVRVFGTQSDTLTQNARHHLGMLNIPFEYIDIREDPDAAAWVRDKNNGQERTPTVDVDGEILAQPTDEQLVAALMRRNLVKSN